jgi:hypothetical protein
VLPYGVAVEAIWKQGAIDTYPSTAATGVRAREWMQLRFAPRCSCPVGQANPPP